MAAPLSGGAIDPVRRQRLAVPRGVAVSRLIAALAVMAVAVAGCGSLLAAQVPVAKFSSAQLQFTAKTLDGHDFRGESLLGKPAVLWFWSPWCPVCQREAPMVGRAAATHPAVTFVGVAGQDQISAMRDFVDKYPVRGFTELSDTDGAVWAKFGVTNQPVFAFVRSDGSGDVVKTRLSESDLTQRIAGLTGR
jgi:thiol-disulfide isomerase/thioredoxin